MSRALLPAALLAATLLAPALHAAEDPAVRRGTDIAEEAQRRASGFGDMQAEAEMRIRNGRGAEALRALAVRILDLPGDASRGLTIVTAPKDVKGTALLTHTLANGTTEQWLYLPSVTRVKRIASSGRSGPFMGSEFSFEDFAAQVPDKYEFRWLRDESWDALPCHVLQRTPRDARDSAWAHQLIWLDREHLRLLRIDYVDRRGETMKRLLASGFRRHEPGQWRAERLLMRNLRTRAESELAWRNIRFGTGLTERDFDVNSLAAARAS